MWGVCVLGWWWWRGAGVCTVKTERETDRWIMWEGRETKKHGWWWWFGGGEGGGKERKRERERERERQRQRQRQGETERDRQMDREREKERESETCRQKHNCCTHLVVSSSSCSVRPKVVSCNSFCRSWSFFSFSSSLLTNQHRPKITNKNNNSETMRPRVFMQNQRTRELISTWNT